MADIKVTPEVLSDQGKQLIAYADQLRGILQDINTKITEIDASWDGLAQNAYLEMYHSMEESLKQFPELVEGLGDATVAAADAFAQVDEQLQNTFRG